MSKHGKYERFSETSYMFFNVIYLSYKCTPEASFTLQLYLFPVFDYSPELLGGFINYRMNFVSNEIIVTSFVFVCFAQNIPNCIVTTWVGYSFTGQLFLLVWSQRLVINNIKMILCYRCFSHSATIRFRARCMQQFLVWRSSTNALWDRSLVFDETHKSWSKPTGRVSTENAADTEKVHPSRSESRTFEQITKKHGIDTGT